MQPHYSDLVDLNLALHMKTERAILVSETGDEAKAVWLPLALCEVVPRPRQAVVVTLPEWLAIEKGLI